MGGCVIVLSLSAMVKYYTMGVYNYLLLIADSNTSLDSFNNEALCNQDEPCGWRFVIMAIHCFIYNTGDTSQKVLLNSDRIS